MYSKRILTSLFIILFCFNLLFADENLKCSDWAKDEIKKASSEGLIPYYVKNSLKKPIDRKNFSHLLILNLKRDFRVNINLVSEKFFDDVDKNDPFYGFIGAAKYYGLITGRSKSIFDKDSKISRKEAVTILGRLSKYYIKMMEYDPQSPDIKPFLESKQYKELEKWARHSVSYFIYSKLLKGDGKGNYNLNDQISAEEAIVLSNRFISHLQSYEKKYFTQEEIKIINKLKDAEIKYPIDYSGKAYEREANIKPNALYVAKLSKTNMQNALNSVNHIRIATGLPTVNSDYEYDKKANFGSFLLYLTNQLSHQPLQKNAPDYVYKIGLEGVTSSNIGKGFNKMNDFNMFCARNEKLEYFSTIIERRWLINPNLSKIGSGMSGSFACTYVLDENRNPPIYPEFLAYPSPIAFPSDYIKDGPWSIQFGGQFSNPKQIYKIPEEKTPVVKLTRLSDGKIVIFDKESEKNQKGNYFYHLDRTNYGYGPAIIFRPDFSPKPTERYKVEINGIIDIYTGEETTLEYETVFF